MNIIRYILQLIGGLVVVIVLAITAAVIVGALLPRKDRRPRAGSIRPAVQHDVAAAIDVEGERIREQDNTARGRIHHPMGHPVSYASLNELMPFTIEAPE